jgi:hypothetical protein
MKININIKSQSGGSRRLRLEISAMSRDADSGAVILKRNTVTLHEDRMQGEGIWERGKIMLYQLLIAFFMYSMSLYQS